ncbi:multidrug/Oligosaccharidyl-lipid/Polysaccharide Flippase superfamily [Thecamonas trahens ATCC 50062]|uniref:Multidrug/Oligosaccharidyl-lipid/Polysaccharide Flippase superfamily n=1 Tax=Thecamonas trahens ATCC 50062 TaxID=461836 RepID=A0A0L0D1J9_THETB|nr:multidrug/Oligosaccharidyl-lipid/Polysaccharide Flippase superfamily [Thecamonas trahens ATCC 50062]KNC46234.1 multidrug/Oligosaccharidyl-lipid/Polysaccharide Flippase superfamily [Thecamonas trahens ATCC 50062]|eukprot:XP_013760531.1 multidrug/Oligosaccharidyl-lipid/Polysaccharide Flippase superfamily [Thecamonas trahens ATCC 50062]
MAATSRCQAETEPLLSTEGSLQASASVTCPAQQPRPEELRHAPTPRRELSLQLMLAAPVAFTVLCRVGMMLTDLAVLGHLSGSALAAASAALIWMNVVLSPIFRGFAPALNVLSAQALGADNPALAGQWALIAVLACSGYGVCVGAAWWWGEAVLLGIGADPAIAAEAGVFMRYSLLWTVPTMGYELLQSFFRAHEDVLPAMVINAAGLVFNLAANVVLVHGAGSWAGMGFVGSPLATAASRWVVFVGYAVYMWATRRAYLKSATPGFSWAWMSRARLVTYTLEQALPLSLSGLIEELQFQVLAVMALDLGAVEIATNNAMFVLFFFLDSAMLGLFTACSIRVGRLLGCGLPQAARRAGVVTFGLSMVVGGAVSLALYLLRAQLGKIVSSDPAIWSEAESIARLLAISYILIGVFYTCMAILDGQARPLPVALAFFVGAWLVCIPLAYVFVFRDHRGLRGIWLSMVIGYSVVTTIAAGFVVTSDWSALADVARIRSECKVKPEPEPELVAAARGSSLA